MPSVGIWCPSVLVVALPRKERAFQVPVHLDSGANHRPTCLSWGQGGWSLRADYSDTEIDLAGRLTYYSLLR